MSDSVPVSVTILEKEYRVGCPAEERNALVASAALLDTRMREIREAGRVVGADRIAVMAALNLTHELLQNRDQKDNLSHSLTQRIRTLQDRIEQALEQGQQLEF